MPQPHPCFFLLQHCAVNTRTASSRASPQVVFPDWRIPRVQHGCWHESAGMVSNLQAIDGAGDAAGAETVVDIDDRHIRTAAIQHTQ